MMKKTDFKVGDVVKLKENKKYLSSQFHEIYGHGPFRITSISKNGIFIRFNGHLSGYGNRLFELTTPRHHFNDDLFEI